MLSSIRGFGTESMTWSASRPGVTGCASTGNFPTDAYFSLDHRGQARTMTAEALAGQLRLPLLVIRLEALITRYMGETAG